jgi:tetrapyrrole methylase family protein/MazG family protein
VATARRLQAPGGCRWDRAQTVASLLPYLIEETWEVFEVVRRRRYRELEEELGDVLYAVLFLALIAERRGWSRLDRLLERVEAKMVRRHPHVFGGGRADTVRAVVKRWHDIKRAEGPKAHSPSKAFRQALVQAWDRVLRDALRTPTPPSGRRARTSARGRRRG